MAEYQAEIIRIRELLATRPDGMSITEISGILDMNRNTISKYMDILQIQGAVDGRKRGTSKVFYSSERLPVTSMRKICTRPFFIIDHEGKIIDLNQEFCTLVAMTGDQVSGHALENLPIRLLEGAPQDQVIKAVLKGTEQRIRAQVRQGEKIHPVTLLMIPVVFENGKPGISVMVDLDNPSAEMTRKDTGSPDVMALLDDEIEYVVRRTAEGITRYVNETYCRAVGKTREELVGRPFKPLISPEDADRIQVHLAGLSVQYPVGTIEYRVVMANGELRHQRWQDRALFNSRGEVDTINSFGIDITEQVMTSRKLKKTQETLEESIVNRTEELRGINRQLYSEIAQRERMEEQLLLAQFAMDRATDMVFWINQDARIRYANDVAAEGLLYPKNELLDCMFGDVVPFYSLEEWDRLWMDLKNGSQVSRETHFVKKDGTSFPADVRLTYLEYRGKEFVYCSSRDLSERIRMDRALKEANKKINVYTSIARHDIQNKITVLLAYLGRTKKAVTDPLLLDYLNHQEEAAKAIRTEINLTRDFKDMGLRSPEWQNMPVIVSGLIHRYAESSVRILSDLPDVEIYADGQLGQVFDRLVEKMRGKNEGDLEIRVSHLVRDGALVMNFKDNGPGFSAEEKSQLFDLQNDGSGNRGLFIAREILSLTDISLSETGEPGKGACFELRVPETYYRFVQETAN
ncbi:MAG: PAS domain S-box protein [Methanoregula sp.]|nr:PAS domain S-box protein [Methanoregula sp.]